MPNVDDIVIFSSFLIHGFGLLASQFFQDMLHYYQIVLVHLNPNSIMHIAIFVQPCEAYLGIPPFFPCFKYLQYQRI
jgi:hypothetical protein